MCWKGLAAPQVRNCGPQCLLQVPGQFCVWLPSSLSSTVMDFVF